MAAFDRSARVSCGLEGLDAILQGGFIEASMQLIAGHTGTGKTTFALQWMLDSRQRGIPVLYVSLSQSRDELERIASSHAWDISELGVIDLRNFTADESDLVTMFRPDEAQLLDTCDRVVAEVERSGARHVVLDTLCEMRLLVDSSLVFRRQMLRLKHTLKDLGCTVMLLDDAQSVEEDATVRNLVDVLLLLEHQPQPYGRDMRRLRLRKMRGSNFLGGYHDYVIETGGIVVHPRVVGDGSHTHVFTDMAATGIEGLDELLGGGLLRGTRTLVFGPTGIGKSTMACQICGEAARRGERSLIWTFDESRATMLQRIKTQAQDGYDTDLIAIRHMNPHTMSPGQLARGIWEQVDAGEDISFLVIDTLNGLEQAIPDHRARMPQLQDLLSRLAERGVISILTMAQWSGVTDTHSQGLVSLLADTILGMHYIRHDGKLQRVAGVLKKRNGAHEEMVRPMQIGDTGMRLGEPLGKQAAIVNLGTLMPMTLPGD